MACAIFGAIKDESAGAYAANAWALSVERGRDAWGIEHLTQPGEPVTRWSSMAHVEPGFTAAGTYIGNRRAEPTTEWVHAKTDKDTQPFHTPGGWVIAHNGTIANDRDIIAALRERRGFFEPETRIDTIAVGVALDVLSVEDNSRPNAVLRAVEMLKGSFALLMVHVDDPGTIWYAVNYKPAFVTDTPHGTYITSQAHYVPHEDIRDPQPVAIPPYTFGRITRAKGLEVLQTLYKPQGSRTLVVCSGGLDSTVAATEFVRRGDEVTLLHLRYGCKAEDREVRAVEEIAERLGCEVVVLTTSFFKDAAPSSLTDDDAEIVTGFGGADGAEYGHEWVPARNTVMMSLAAAYAEAYEYDRIVLGNNLEESGGGYPDNEQEFINRWNDLLPFAVKPYANITIEQPLGSLMKHEIVAKGLELDAPMELTWSCYSGGDTHCGTCGPCFMRKTAFQMNNATDPVMEA